ncbi:hypothetical protein ACFSWE_14985 [Leucobacter albus]|uniref:Uncharacterized protein n=1 Tax=Leucobacter albus TaxID=272210 RepID=A0ABW3TLV5_9MICO
MAKKRSYLFGVADRDYEVGEVVDEPDFFHIFDVVAPIKEGDTIYYDPCEYLACHVCYPLA